MKKILLIIMTFFVFSVKVQALEDLAPTSKGAILIEASTGKVLFEKSPDEKLPPASMTKLASMMLVMEQIDSGKLSMDDMVTISDAASKMGGSQVFLQAGEKYSVHDLLKSVAIASANDAVVALAEKIAGSEAEFVVMLNNRLKEIGAKNTNFLNAHGLDAEGHVSTPRDMSIIAQELLKHERILEFTSTYEDYLKKNDGSEVWLVNTNRLVKFYEGVDGLKTGFTSNAGYCLTATANKNNMRLISVVMGEDTTENRSSDTVKMLNYGFNTYKLNTYKKKDEVIGRVRVEKGKKDFVELTLVDDATEILKNTDDAHDYKFKIMVDKLKAPINKGDVVGIAEVIDKDGNVIEEVDVTVKEDVKKANILDYLWRNIKVISAGKIILKNN